MEDDDDGAAAEPVVPSVELEDLKEDVADGFDEWFFCCRGRCLLAVIAFKGIEFGFGFQRFGANRGLR